nr:RecName: Full=Putative Na(+)/H(+) antiporter [Cycas revoluta]
FGVLAVTSR